MTNLTMGPSTGKRSVLRLVAASLVTLLAGLVATVFWIVGQAQYLNEYCHLHAREQPKPTPPELEALSGRPAYLDGPMTVVCEYDQFPTIREIAPIPFVFALILAAVIVGIGVGTFRWAWRPKPPQAGRPAS